MRSVVLGLNLKISKLVYWFSFASDWSKAQHVCCDCLECCSEISELQSFSNVFDNHRKTGRAIEVFPCNVSTVKRLLS